MARLQDFPSVTPTSSDKILIVQSQGQGLAPHTIKLDSENPTGTGALSMNRKANTTVGYNSTTEGSNCEASGGRSHAEGEMTVASGNDSHAEGYNTTASNTASHAEGSGTTASGNRGHAEGLNSTASGDYSHAEGVGTTASGDNGSHSEGNTTIASGVSSHAEGVQTRASRRSQHVFGEYNIEDTSGANTGTKGAYIEIVGKGSNDANRSNARTLDWSGNEVLAGDLTFKGNISLNTLTTLLQGMESFRIAANSSKNVTVTADGNGNFSFLVVGIGRENILNPILMHIGGYVTASRSLITNITGKTGLTVDNSSTTDTKFVFTDTSTANHIDIRLIPLLDNKFTVS